MSHVHYVSPMVQIGKHYWRVAVVSRGDSTPRYTEYQWRHVDGQGWQGHKQWPAYDINNGMTLGLPKSIQSKVFGPYQASVLASLHHTATPEQIEAGYAKRREAIDTYHVLLDDPNYVNSGKAEGYLIRTMAYARAMRAGLSHVPDYLAADRYANL